MSAKTSTAALDSFRHKPLRNLRRVPCHPAGASPSATPRSNAETQQDRDSSSKHGSRVFRRKS